MNFFEKAKKKIVELWQGANLWQKVGIGVVVLILLFIKIIKWVFLFSLLSAPFVWFCSWLCKGFSGLVFKEQLTAVGAFITAVIAVWRLCIADANKKIADKTLRTEQKKELHERYARAVELLSNDDDAVRMGALYSLKQISEENDGEFFEQCKEIIAGYVRNRLASDEWKESKAAWEEEYKQDINKRRYLPEDVKTGVNLLSALAKPKEKEINLQEIDLSGVDFSISDIVFNRINFSYSKFYACRFKHFTDFSTCRFIRCDFRYSYLKMSRFEGTYLGGSNFSNAVLFYTNFTDVNLGGSIFKDVIIPEYTKIKLDKAILYDVICDKEFFNKFINKVEYKFQLLIELIEHNPKYSTLQESFDLTKNPNLGIILPVIPEQIMESLIPATPQEPQ